MARMGAFDSFLSLKTQATWLRVNKMTPHQCWTVCDWEATEKDKPSSAQLSLPTCTQRKSGNQSSDCGHHTFDKRYTSSSQPSKLFTQTRWHEGRDGTPSFRRHTLFKLYQHFEGNRPANSTQKTHIIYFLPLL